MRKRRVIDGCGAPHRPLLGERVELMCAVDRRTHYVSDIVYGTTLAASTGQCPAVCGHVVLLSALDTPPGPLCPLCRATP